MFVLHCVGLCDHLRSPSEEHYHICVSKPETSKRRGLGTIWSRYDQKELRKFQRTSPSGRKNVCVFVPNVLRSSLGNLIHVILLVLRNVRGGS